MPSSFLQRGMVLKKRFYCTNPSGNNSAKSFVDNRSDGDTYYHDITLECEELWKPRFVSSIVSIYAKLSSIADQKTKH